MGKQKSLFPIKKYCIDTSCLIDLYQNYPKKSVSGFFNPIWEKIENMIGNRQIISHITVFRELKKREDSVFKWCKGHAYIFVDIDECQISKLQEIKGKYNKDYFQRQLSNTGEWADPWIIALANCEDAIVVTNENKTKANRIPLIADQIDIKSLNLLEFFEEILNTKS